MCRPARAAHRLVAARQLYGLPLSYIIWSLALLTVILGFGDAQFLLLVFMAFVGAQLSEDSMTQILGPQGPHGPPICGVLPVAEVVVAVLCPLLSLQEQFSRFSGTHYNKI
jgi:hypothetical protein